MVGEEICGAVISIRFQVCTVWIGAVGRSISYNCMQLFAIYT